MYKVTEKDLIGDLRDFPIEVVQMMLQKQVEQGHKEDIEQFQTMRTRKIGGFYWDKTKEGFDFWYEIINNRNFDLFFEKYPKKKEGSIKLKKTTHLKLNFNL